MYPYLDWPATMPDALTQARPPSVVIDERLVSVAIESAGTNVGVELAVPGCGVELQIPTAELGELRLGKRRDLAFDLFDGTHDTDSDPVYSSMSGESVAPGCCWSI